MDVFNAFKGIAGMIRDAIDTTMPRQAVVTRPEGAGVWVRFTPVDASKPEMWFPSTVSGLPAGTAGWVHPLAGGKGRFIADAVPEVHQLRPYWNGGDPRNTTSIDPASPFWFTGDAPDVALIVPLPAGVWEFSITASIKLKRSVNSGGSRLVLLVDDTLSGAIDYQTAPKTDFFYHSIAQRFVVNVSESRPVEIRIGFCGWSTAATTYGYHPQITGTYTKIG